MLQVSPDELVLEGPFGGERRTVFSLLNKSGEYQAFRIKSTAPDVIGLSPSSGFIKPFERIEVLVEVPGNHRVDPLIRDKEKFLIQSALTAVPSATSTPKDVLRLASNVAALRLLLRFKNSTPDDNDKDGLDDSSFREENQDSHSAADKDYSNPTQLEIQAGPTEEEMMKDVGEEELLLQEEITSKNNNNLSKTARTPVENSEDTRMTTIKELSHRVNCLEAMLLKNDSVFLYVMAGAMLGLLAAKMAKM